MHAQTPYPEPARMRPWWRPVAALFFAAACLYHVVALARPELAEPSSPWRHGLFAVVNGSLSAGLLSRIRGLLPALAILTAQQLWSHGSYALRVWADERRVDWASVVVLIGLPLLLGAVAVDARSQKSAAG